MSVLRQKGWRNFGENHTEAVKVVSRWSETAPGIRWE
jgi:hypothetical protein